MIFLECNLDELLIKILGFTRKQISHQRCKGEVIKKVGNKSRAIGLIDEDYRPNAPNEMKNYNVKQTHGSITIFQRKNDKKKQLVQVSPYLEHWLLERAKRNKIDPKDYNLPKDPQKLHGKTNLERNKNFREFLKKLIDTDNEIQTLKKWLEEALG